MNYQREKEASVLGLLGTTAALHTGANLAMMGAKNTKGGQEMLADTMRAGFHHGRKNKQLAHGVRRGLKYGLGPESLMDYQLGHAAGNLARDAGKNLPRSITKDKYKLMDRAKRILTKDDKSVLESLPETTRKAVKKTILGTAMEAGHRELHDKKSRTLDFMTKSVAKTAKPTKAQNVLHAMPLATAAMVDPHFAIHPGLNAIRDRVSKTEKGKEFMRKQFIEGLRGDKMSKAKELASDVIISPGALESRRVGKALNLLSKGDKVK
jgi:hypothetical protein